MQSRTTAVALLALLVATSGCSGILGGSAEPATTGNESTASEMQSATGTTSTNTGPTAELTGGLNDENVSYSGVQPVLEPGTDTNLELNVLNEMGAETEFEVVVLAQYYETTNTSADESVRVTSQETLAAKTVTVADGGTKSIAPTVSVDKPGTNVRLVFLLYEGEAPENPSMDSALNANAIPINVGSSDDDEQINVEETETETNSSSVVVPT